MAYSTPRTWTAGEYPTAVMLNANVRDNVSFLASPPSCRVYNSALINVVNATDTLLTFDSERFDTNTMHDTVTNPGRITFTTAGVYVVSFTGQFIAATDYTQGNAYIRLNGTTPIGLGSSVGTSTLSTAGMFVSCHTIYKFAAADYVEVMVRQTNGAAATRAIQALGNYSFECSAVWIGLGT